MRKNKILNIVFVLIICLGLIGLSLLLFWNQWVEFYKTIINFGSSLYYNISYWFNDFSVEGKMYWNEFVEYNGNVIQNIIEEEKNELVNSFELYFSYLFNWRTLHNYVVAIFLTVLDFLINNYIWIYLAEFILILMLIYNNVDSKAEAGDISKAKLIKDKLKTKIQNSKLTLFCKSLIYKVIDFLKTNSFIILPVFVFVSLVNINNLLGLVVNLFSLNLTFPCGGAKDFGKYLLILLYNQFSNYSLITWLGIIMLVVYLTIKSAYKKKDEQREVNIETLQNTGVNVLITGSSGSGKTKMQVNMAYDLFVAQKEKAKKNMKRIENKYPSVDYALLRKKFDAWIKPHISKRYVNRYHVEYYCDLLTKKVILDNPDFDINSNNFKNFKNIPDYLKFSEIKMDDCDYYPMTVFDAIKNYILLYYIYHDYNMALVSIMPVRIPFEYLQKGDELGTWNFDHKWIRRTKDLSKYEVYSTILNYDALRLYERKNDLTEDFYSFPILLCDEISTERGNKNSKKRITDEKGKKKIISDRDSEIDGFSTFLNTTRHNNVVWNDVYTNVIFVAQRINDWRASESGAVECNLHLTCAEEKKKNTLPFYVKPIVIIINKLSDRYCMFMENNDKNHLERNLVKDFMIFILKPFYNLATLIDSQFSYAKKNFTTEANADGHSGSLKRKFIYLDYSTVYAKAYATDYYGNALFKPLQKKLKSTRSKFKSFYATEEDLKRENSYTYDNIQYCINNIDKKDETNDSE